MTTFDPPGSRPTVEGPAEPDFPIGLRGLSLGPRGKGGPAVQPPPLGKKGGKGRKRKRKEGRTKERRKER